MYLFFCFYFARWSLLVSVIQDERLCDIETVSGIGGTSLVVILTKTCKEQIISESELVAFVETLQPHQKAVSHCVSAWSRRNVKAVCILKRCRSLMLLSCAL